MICIKSVLVKKSYYIIEKDVWKDDIIPDSFKFIWKDQSLEFPARSSLGCQHSKQAVAKKK